MLGILFRALNLKPSSSKSLKTIRKLSKIETFSRRGDSIFSISRLVCRFCRFRDTFSSFMRILPTLFYIETKKELSVWRPKNRESPLGERMKAGQCRIICLVQSGARMSIAIVLKGQKIKQILNFVLMDEMVFCYQNCSDLQCEKVVW